MRKYLKKDIRAVCRSHLFDVVPGKELVDLALFMAIHDSGEGRREPSVGIDGIHLAGFDERGDDGPVFCTGVMSGEEGVFPVQGNGTDGAFDCVAVDLDATIDEEAAEAVAVFGDIGEGLAERRFR